MNKTIALIALAGLSACATPEPQIITRIQLLDCQPPPALLSCPAAPDWPAEATDADVAQLILYLHTRGDACASTLARLTNWVETQCREAH